jgi:hypothetical protein
MWQAAAALATAACLALPAPALAAPQGPYITVRDDDGSIENPDLNSVDGVKAVIVKILALYGQAGGVTPDVLSVWTTFPFGGEPVSTIFIPLVEDIAGLNLESTFTLDVSEPPLRSVLLHNDVTQLDYRADVQKAPREGIGTYLFLLEFTHNWGPEVQIPMPNPGELIGFDFHWSFWMDAGGSPAGGNAWVDNGDGTFTVSGQLPSTVKYSMVDLYLMGLADPSEVPPFGVLENPVPPSGITDPFTGRALSGSSFPWFRPDPLTVQATRRDLTIDDLVTANGARNPARAGSPSSFKVGIVLVVGQNATDAQVASAQAVMDPLSQSYAPAFAQATSQRGTLEVVSLPPVADGGPADGGTTDGSAGDAGASDALADAAPAGPDTAPAADASPPAPDTAGPTVDLGGILGHGGGGGCSVLNGAAAGDGKTTPLAVLFLLLALVLASNRLSRRPRLR